MSVDVDDVRAYLVSSIHRMNLCILDTPDYSPVMRSAQAKRDAYENMLRWLDQKRGERS